MKNYTTPVHYDYQTSEYKEGYHPASHMHIGTGNNIRLASKKILNPMSFTLHIIRHHYLEQWKALIGDGTIKEVGHHVSIALDNVPEEYWKEYDHFELALQ